MKARQDPSRFALGFGIVSLLLWPLSYAWLPNADRNANWILVLVPVAELGAVVCAVAAIWLGFRGRRQSELKSRGALWAPRLGGLTLALMVIAFVFVSALYR